MLNTLNTAPNPISGGTPLRKQGSAVTTEEDRSPVDRLPDLESIEEQVQLNQAGTEQEQDPEGLSIGKKVVLAAAGLTAAAAGMGVLASPADAQPFRALAVPATPTENHVHKANDLGWGLLGLFTLGLWANSMNQYPCGYYNCAPQYVPVPVPVPFPGGHPGYQQPRPYYDTYGRLICPHANGNWHVAPDNYNCW